MNKPRLLVVDDNAMNSDLLDRFFKNHGYQVDVAYSGIDCLALIESNEYAALVLDIQMPGMDGLEVVRRIREHERDAVRTMPVLAVTALAYPEDRNRCMEAGSTAYFAKPVKLKELLASIELHISSVRGQPRSDLS